MSRLVIYTAITGGKDNLHEPAHILPGADYICFTDTPGLTSKTFTLRPLPFTEKDSRLTARRLKLFPHELFPDHHESLWIDGSKRIRADLSPLLAECAGTPFMVLRHPARDCAYDETEDCLLKSRDHASALIVQAAAYHAEGLPPHSGLYETSVLFRRHTPENAALMQAWWQELQTRSARDQVSLPYILWKKATPILALDYRRWHDPFFLQYPHRWNPKGDHRNRLTARFHAHLWHLIQSFGLQTPYEQAIKRAKHLNARWFS